MMAIPVLWRGWVPFARGRIDLGREARFAGWLKKGEVIKLIVFLIDNRKSSNLGMTSKPFCISLPREFLGLSGHTSMNGTPMFRLRCKRPTGSHLHDEVRTTLALVRSRSLLSRAVDVCQRCKFAGIGSFIANQHAVDIQKDDLHVINLSDLRSPKGHTYQSAAKTIAATTEAAVAIETLESAFKNTT